MDVSKEQLAGSIWEMSEQVCVSARFLRPGPIHRLPLHPAGRDLHLPVLHGVAVQVGDDEIDFERCAAPDEVTIAAQANVQVCRMDKECGRAAPGLAVDILLTISDSPEGNKYSNMCFEGFNPVIQLIYSADSLSFLFDSGANATSLLIPFFNLYKRDIEDKNTLTDIIIGGAGGEKKFKGYRLNNITLQSGDLSAEIKNVVLIIEKIKDDSMYFFGKLGQDYLKKFNQIKFNFKTMYIEFN